MPALLIGGQSIRFVQDRTDLPNAAGLYASHSAKAASRRARKIFIPRHFPPCSHARDFIDGRNQTECGRSSGVEHNLAKVRVESSNLFARSSFASDNSRLDGVAFGRPFAFRPDGTESRLFRPFAAQILRPYGLANGFWALRLIAEMEGG